MTKQTLSNGQTGLQIREAINGNFTELYAVAGGGSEGTPWYWNPPLAADFTYSYGVDDLTLEDDLDVGLLVQCGVAADDNVAHIRSKAIANPTDDWTITARLNILNSNANYSGIGLWLINSADPTHVCQFRIENDNMCDVGWWTLPSTFFLNGNGTKIYTQTGFFRIMHIAASSKYQFWFSTDGKIFGLIDECDDDFALGAPADRIGVGCWYARTGMSAGMSIASWVEDFS